MTKEISKQSLKQLIKFALDMPAGELTQYGTLFLTGPMPENMTRGELIALQLVNRASFGDLDAIKELRNWVVEDPKNPGSGGGDTYYQFLVDARGAGAEAPAPEALKNLAKTIEVKIEREKRNLIPSKILDDL